MSMNRIVLGASLAAVLTLAPALRGDDKADADLKKLQGKWTTESGGGGKVTWTFKDKSLKIVAPSRTYEMTLVVDAAAKPDKTIDFKIDEAPDDSKGKTSKGIYKFSGDDTLVFCFRPEGDRPTEYKMEGFEQILTELKRSKD